jgi:hypothetical protein
MITKWKYNDKIYESRQILQKELGFSSCKFAIKVKENKIIKITIEDESYDNTTINI